MKEDLSWSLFSQHIIDHLWLSNHENYDKYSVNVKKQTHQLYSNLLAVH